MSIVHLDTGKGGDSAGESGADSNSEAAYVEAMRLRAATALERAYGFLADGPDPWVRFRADVLCEAAPASDLSSRLEDTMEADGSFPLLGLVAGGGLGFPVEDASALEPSARRVVGTLEALLIAADARMLHAGWVESAVRFLETTQQRDGSFSLDGVGRVDESTIFWTGMIAGVLGRTPVSRPVMLEAAGEFLAAHFDPEAVEHDGYSALLGYSNYFTNVAHDLADEALQWCGRALEKGFRSRHLDAVSTVRVLLTCDAQAMPGATFDVAELLDRLLEEQAGDGGFAELALGGPPARTTQTFDAMLAIVRLCAALEA